MANADSFNKSGFVDAQATNDSSQSIRQYSDLDLFFIKKSSTSDINKVTDILAVKRSVRNLLFTSYYEKPFHPEIGCGLRGMLFEPTSFITAAVLERMITDVIENFEPRVDLTNVVVKEKLGGDGYDVQINFSVLNIEENEQTLTVLLERIR